MKTTYEIVANSIREHGAEKVREIVFGPEGRGTHRISHESVAIANFIESRMFKKELVDKLKDL